MSAESGKNKMTGINAVRAKINQQESLLLIQRKTENMKKN